MKKALLGKVASSLLLSAGLLASGAAAADTTLTLDAAGNAGFHATHAMAGSFEDVFLFTIDDQGWAVGNAIGGFTTSWETNYNITDVQFFWQNGATREEIDTTFNAMSGFVGFRAVNGLAPGTYGFTVTGSTAIAGTGGSFAGNLHVSPVPEPASYAMLTVGIGLLALSARRKTDTKLG